MSHAAGQIRFADGDVYHVEYNGTTDIVGGEGIYRTPKELSDHWRIPRKACTCGQPPEVVEYWTTYGEGWLFPAEACRPCGVVIGGDPYEEMSEIEPDWLDSSPWP